MEVPTRTCIACRQPAMKPSLIRLVAVDGTVQVDRSAVVQARGAYLCATHDCVETALRREGAAIARALRCGRDGVQLPALRDSLDREIGARDAAHHRGNAAEQQFGDSRDDKVTATPSRGVCT